MRKALVTLAVIILALPLAGCKKGDEWYDPTKNTVNSTTK